MEVIADLSKKFGQIREQGERGTCLAFATTSAHEYLHKLSQPLCVEWLYFYTSMAEGKSLADMKSGVGIDIPCLLEVLQSKGQPFESVWPYIDDPKLQIWEPPHNPEPLFYASSAYSSFKLNEILTFLDLAQPVVLTFWAEEEFLHPEYKEDLAIVDIDPPSSKIAMHAILVVGYGFLNNKVYIKVRNSWGIDWGINGHAWVSEEFLSAYADEYISLEQFCSR